MDGTQTDSQRGSVPLEREVKKAWGGGLIKVKRRQLSEVSGRDIRCQGWKVGGCLRSWYTRPLVAFLFSKYWSGICVVAGKAWWPNITQYVYMHTKGAPTPGQMFCTVSKQECTFSSDPCRPALILPLFQLCQRMVTSFTYNITLQYNMTHSLMYVLVTRSLRAVAAQ